MSIDAVEEKKTDGKWHVLTVVSILLIITVLTNDYHQKVFVFLPGFHDWDSSYTYGPLFYPIIVFVYGLYNVAFVLMILKCRLSFSKRLAWIVTIPFLIGVILTVLILRKTMSINGVIGTTEVFCYMAAAFLNSCITIGLIPSNEAHSLVLNESSLNIAIMDSKGNLIYQSEADEIDDISEAVETECASDVQVSDNCYMVKKYDFRNGYAIWKEDVSEISRINEELEQAYERLSEEADLIRLENELKAENIKIRIRTRLYDDIAKQTSDTNRLICECASGLNGNRYDNARYICFLGSYIKRYANLMIMSGDMDRIAVSELYISVKESLKYLNYMGIPGEISMENNCIVNIDSTIVIDAYRLFYNSVTGSYGLLKGFYSNIRKQKCSNGEYKVVFKINLEGILPDRDELTKNIDFSEWINVDYEDDITYITADMGGVACYE